MAILLVSYRTEAGVKYLQVRTAADVGNFPRFITLVFMIFIYSYMNLKFPSFLVFVP